MNRLLGMLARSVLMKKDLDYVFIRASLVFTFLIFGYQKWSDYVAHMVIDFIRSSPLVFWLYPAFGIHGASMFLGATEWIIGLLLLLGFWNKRLGVVGALGSTFTYLATFTIIPFFPNAWAAPAGGFPIMNLPTGFLMKDVVLLAASVYLLKEDVARATAVDPQSQERVVLMGNRT
jgi:uncharacterized membrane protein YkgB